jgi:Tol biopolymer transport system component
MNSRIVKAVVLAIGLCAAVQTSLAQKSKPEPPVRDALAAMFDVHQFLQAQISPDGKQTAWVESLPGPGGAPSSNSAIYVANLASPALPKRITAASGEAAHEEHDIAWSADSKRIAFLSDARTPGQLQLFIADAAGVSAKQLTHLKGFLSGPAWSPNGKTIALLFTENATRSSGPLVAETPDEGVVSDEFLEQRLTLVDPTTGRSRQISAADMYVYEFDWSPDSQRLVITAAHGNGDNNWYIAGLYTVAAASGSLKPVAEKPGMQIADPRWSPDGSEIAFIGGLMSDEPVPGGDVYIASVAGESKRNLTSGMKATADSLTWLPDSRSLILAGIADGQVSLDRLELDGTRSTLWSRLCCARRQDLRRDPPVIRRPARGVGGRNWRLEADHPPQCAPQSRMGRGKKSSLEKRRPGSPGLAYLSARFRPVENLPAGGRCPRWTLLGQSSGLAGPLVL